MRNPDLGPINGVNLPGSIPPLTSDQTNRELEELLRTPGDYSNPKAKLVRRIRNITVTGAALLGLAIVGVNGYETQNQPKASLNPQGIGITEGTPNPSFAGGKPGPNRIVLTPGPDENKKAPPPSSPIETPVSIGETPYRSTEMPAWFGGIYLNMKINGQNPVVFSDTVKGPNDLYKGILQMLATKGTHGTTVKEVQNYLDRTNGIFEDFTNVTTLDAGGNRFPPFMQGKSKFSDDKSIILDLRKGFSLETFNEGNLPPEGLDPFFLGGNTGPFAKAWSTFGVDKNGKLRFGLTTVKPDKAPEDTYEFALALKMHMNLNAQAGKIDDREYVDVPDPKRDKTWYENMLIADRAYYLSGIPADRKYYPLSTTFLNERDRADYNIFTTSPS